MPDLKKIGIITTSLGTGGAEKTAALESLMFTSLGHKVTLISMHNDIVYNYKGSLIVLTKEDSVKENLFTKLNKAIKLKQILRKGKFDLIVDNRMRSNSILVEFFFTKYIYKNFYVAYVLNLNDFSKKLKEFPMLLKKLYKKAFKIIAVCDEAKNHIIKVYGFKNVKTIYNTFDGALINQNKETLKLPYSYILYFGRMLESHKNLKFLIKSYHQSLLPKKGIKLVLLGEGEDLIELKKLTKELNLESNIVFIPFVENPYDYVKEAQFTVLTSHFEGFPLTLVESLACGTPIVAVDCKTGPSEIVINNYNGLIVKSNDIQVFTNALNEMVTNISLDTLSKNALKSSLKFSEKEVAKQWQNVLDEI